jgi:hypothetical protein
MRFTSIALALVASAATTNAFSVAPLSATTSFVTATRTTVVTRGAPVATALFLQPQQQQQHSEEESLSLEADADESANANANALNFQRMEDASKIAVQSAFAWAVTTQMASAAGPDWGT